MAILVEKKRLFKSKKVTRSKEGHYISIKDSIEQEDIISINIYTSHDRSSK